MKRILSIVLATVLLLGVFTVLPLSAYAEETDVAEVCAEEEIAGTGDDIVIEVYNATQLRTHLEANITDKAVKLVLMNDISEYVGEAYEGDYKGDYYPDERLNGDGNRVPVWCTVGKGQKIIDLNNHSFYASIYYGGDHSSIERKNNECLFSIPADTSLTVNGGGTSNTDTGSIVYDGTVLYQCDCIDQRDIFHVDGGSLTINSGRFAPSYRNRWYNNPYYTVQQINGTAITVNKGELTVNGGYFEGRGMSSYTFKNSSYTWDIMYQSRNGSLEINGGKVTINDGHFVGVGSGSAVIDMSNGKAENHYYNGHFTVAYDHEWYAVWHDKNAPQYFDGGIIGIKLDALDPNTNYYIAPYDPITNAADITDISDLRYHYNDFQPVDFYIRPKSKINEASGAPSVDNKTIKFVRGTTPVVNDEEWNLNTDNVLDVDPSTLYFPIIDNTHANVDARNNKQVRQSLPATISVHEYISEGNRPEIASGIRYSPKKRSDDPTDTWQIDLKEAIPASTLNSLQDGHDYVIAFDFREVLYSQDRTYTATHKAYYYFTASKSAGAYTVSGTVTSFLSDTETVWIALGTSEAIPYATFVKGNNASYSIPNVAAGTYTLAVTKKNHVVRTYELTVLGNKKQDLKICPKGDVDGNGKVQANDAMKAYQHAQGKANAQLSGYAFDCADIAPVGSPNGKVQAADAMVIYQQAQGKHSLF